MCQNIDMPKIIGTTLADHRQITRQRLFDALSELMTSEPFDAITMSEIAQHAGVGRTAIYNHFADKESLLLALMNETTGQFVEVLKKALMGHDDPIDQLRIYLRQHLELKEQLHLASGINLRTQMSSESTARLHDHAGLVEHILFHILEGAMSSGRIPRQNTLALVSLIHSTLAGQTLPDDEEERQDTIHLTIAFILRAIGANEDDAPLPPKTSGHHADSDTGEEHHGDPSAYLRCPVSRV